MNENNQPSVKKDVYAIVTDNVVAQLEKGIIPWRKPWSDGGVPQNLSLQNSRIVSKTCQLATNKNSTAIFTFGSLHFT